MKSKLKRKPEQLMLFDMPKTEMDALWEAITSMKMSHDKVRKRLFKEIKELEDRIVEVKAENERLKFAKQTLRWTA